MLAASLVINILFWLAKIKKSTYESSDMIFQLIKLFDLDASLICVILIKLNLLHI